MNLQSFTKAGMTATEVSQIVGVSRSSVGLWMREQRKPHPLIRERIEAILEKVDDALDEGLLPLPATTPREQRLDEIKKLLY